MANLRIKYVVDGVTKNINFNRATMGFADLKEKIAAGSGKSAFTIRYQGTAGEIFIDSDDSLKQAISDNDRARRTDLTVIVGGPGEAPVRSAPAPATSYQPATSSAPAAATRSAPPPQPAAAPAPSRQPPPAGTILSFTMPGTGTSDKIKIEPQQFSDHFLFTPIASRYQTEVNVVLEGSKLIYNNNYSFQEGNQMKNMTLTQTFNLPFVPRPDQVKIQGNTISLYFQ